MDNKVFRSSSMKVCMISEAKSIHTRRWTQGLALAGCEMHLISSSKADIPGVKLHHIPIYSSNPAKQIVNNLRIRKLIKSLNPDVVHLFGLYSVNSLLLLPVIYRLKNLLISPWGTDIVFDGSRESSKSIFIKKFILRQAKTITSLSKFLSRQIERYLTDDTLLELIYWGINTDIFRPGNHQTGHSRITLGTTKALTEKYGHKYLLWAMPEVIKKFPDLSIKLVIVGKGELKNKLKLMSEELSIEKHLSFFDHVNSEKEIIDHLKTFDIYVMPSTYQSETLGVAAIEASAMEIPVIGSNIGGIPEVVKDGETGFLVEPCNSRDIATKLISLISNSELRKKMGHAGRKRVNRLFCFDKSIRKMKQVYFRVSIMD